MTTSAPRRLAGRPGLWVGLFVIGAVVLTVLGALWLSGSNLFARQQIALIRFQGGVAGLYVGAPVTFRGVPVGQVESIGVEVDTNTLAARIPVRVRLNDESVRFTAGGGAEGAALDVGSLVQRGLRARLVAQSFVTGQKAIDLDFVRDAPPAPVATAPTRVPEIPAQADRFDMLFDQVAALPLRETVEDLRRTLVALQETLTEVRGTLSSARGAVDGAASAWAGLATQGQRTLADASAALNLLRDDTRKSLAALNELLARSRTTIDQAQPELQATLASARSAAAAAERAMARVDELTDPRAPLRGDLDAAVRDLSQAARGLREWSELLEEKPNAVIFGRERP
jgi:paraquat-inducible protein B